MQTTDQPINRSTNQRLNSNRSNAQRSTGPRTPEGKAVSSGNALTHGLAANRTVLPGEDPQDFQTLLSNLAHEFQPATELQRNLVRQLADAEWRLRRIPDFEAGLLTRRLDTAHSWVENYPENGPADQTELEPWLRGEVLISDADGADPLSKLSRYESRLTRNYFKALEQLRLLQTPRAPHRPTTMQKRTTAPPRPAAKQRPNSPKPRAPKKKN